MVGALNTYHAILDVYIVLICFLKIVKKAHNFCVVSGSLCCSGTNVPVLSEGLNWLPPVLSIHE